MRAPGKPPLAVTSDAAVKAAVEALRGLSGKAVLEIFLQLPELPAPVRRAVMTEMGRSPQREQRDQGDGWTAMLQVMVSAFEARLRHNRSRPHGGAHGAALERVGQYAGMSSDSLKRRFARHKERGPAFSPKALIEGWLAAVTAVKDDRAALQAFLDQVVSSAPSLGAAVERHLMSKRSVRSG
jgi:hypothetical protein